MSSADSVPNAAAASAGRPLVVGHASFLDRNDPWHTRLLMNLADGILAGVGFLLRLGGQPLRHGLIRLLTWLASRFSAGKRHVALVNLDLVYGERMSEARKQEIVAGMFQHFARWTVDFLFDYVYWPPRQLLASTTMDGHASVRDASAIEQILAAGRGFALVGCHLGNIELLQRLVAARGQTIYIVYKGFSGAWFDRFVGRKRLAYGNGLIEVPSSRHRLVGGRREKLPRASLRADIETVWGMNQGIGFLCDQYTRNAQVSMDFLGVPDTPMQTGLLSYAVENRIPLALQVLVYEGNDRLRWFNHGPISIEEQPGGAEATLRHYVKRVNDWSEQLIHRYPEQYAWGHRRFRREYYRLPRPVRADALAQPPAAPAE